MARQRPPVWLILAAAAYLAYYSLLIYCHVHRPDATGLPPATPGLARAQLDAYNLALPLGEASFDPARDVVLYGFRFVQLITLVLAITVAFRRPRDPIALSGAWLLATAGVFSIALPAGWATAWRQLPPVVDAALWFPFLSTIAAGGILYVFAARFTRARRALSVPAIAGLALLLAGPLVWRALARMSLVYGWNVTPRDSAVWLIAANAMAGTLGLALLYRHYSGTRDIIEKRRAHLVLAGGSVGMAAGIAVMLAAGTNGPLPGRSFFASTSITIGTLVFLLFPLSFAYAILRYRLFGLRGAIRLGLRYAVARRALLSIVPAAVIALAFDIWSQGERPLREILSARSGFYLLLAGGAVTAHFTRHRWLEILDRTFFRERYDARRILIDLVGELRSSRRFDDVAALAVTTIERALHPKFLLVGRRGHDTFESAAGFRPEKAPALPASGSVLLELARVLKQPIDLASDSSGWLSERLPPNEVRYVRDGHIELLVPVTSPEGTVDAVLLLGPKRSEEPYTREDRELLSAIADGLALTLAQARSTAPLQDVELPRLVGDRYRLERVIGRGGMGIVYEARDVTLERQVAVKLMRGEIIGSADAVRRFKDEARSAARFAHPNVITIFDFDVDAGGASMIVMELLAGHTLRAELTGSPLSAQRTLWIVAGISEAVDSAHEHGLLHRDLKPENVFLADGASGECVKILDFGIARPIGERPESRGGATLDGVLVGTPRYMAPEQLAGGPPAPSWDLWAIAVMACEMLTAAHPFAGSRPSAAMPPALDDFFTQALAAQPAGRFSSARELCARLGQAIGVTPV